MIFKMGAHQVDCGEDRLFQIEQVVCINMGDMLATQVYKRWKLREAVTARQEPKPGGLV